MSIPQEIHDTLMHMQGVGDDRIVGVKLGALRALAATPAPVVGEPVAGRYSVAGGMLNEIFDRQTGRYITTREAARILNTHPAPAPTAITDEMVERACEAVCPVSTGHPWSAVKDTRAGEILPQHIRVVLNAARGIALAPTAITEAEKDEIEAAEGERIFDRVCEALKLDPNDGDCDSSDHADFIVNAVGRHLERLRHPAPAPTACALMIEPRVLLDGKAYARNGDGEWYHGAEWMQGDRVFLDRIAELEARLATATADAARPFSDGWLVWARKKPGGRRHLVTTEHGALIPYEYCRDARFLEAMRANGLTEWELVRVNADPAEWKWSTPLVHVTIDAARAGAHPSIETQS
jgi:hypothetical protein